MSKKMLKALTLVAILCLCVSVFATTVFAAEEDPIQCPECDSTNVTALKIADGKCKNGTSDTIKYTCQDCKYRWFGVKAVPHTFAPDAEPSYELEGAKEPTCTEKGLAGMQCTVCEHIVLTEVDKNPDNHDFSESVAITEGSCTVKGVTAEGTICSRCGAPDPDNPPTYDETPGKTGEGHNFAEPDTDGKIVAEKSGAKKAATCTEDGANFNFGYCETCKKYYNLGELTCDAEGADMVDTVVEGDFDSVKIDKTGHDWFYADELEDQQDAWHWTLPDDDQCEEVNGVKQPKWGVKPAKAEVDLVCLNCAEEKTFSTTSADEIVADGSLNEEVTCVNDGRQEWKATVKDDEGSPIPAIEGYVRYDYPHVGHVYDAEKEAATYKWTSDEEYAADWISLVITVPCANCDEETTILVNWDGETESAITKNEGGKEPTCKETGTASFTVNYTLGDDEQIDMFWSEETKAIELTNTKEYNSIPTIPHTWDSEEAHAVNEAATCTEPKVKLAYWYCTECEQYFGDSEGEPDLESEPKQKSDVIEKDAEGHAWQRDDAETIAKGPDAVKEGYDPKDDETNCKFLEQKQDCEHAGYVYWYCQYCAKENPKGEPLPDGTEQEAGYRLTREQKGALGHDFTKDGIIPATCTENAKNTTVCSRCGKPDPEKLDEAEDLYEALKDVMPEKAAEYKATGHKLSETPVAYTSQEGIIAEPGKDQHVYLCENPGCDGPSKEYNEETNKWYVLEDCTFDEEIHDDTWLDATCDVPGQEVFKCDKCTNTKEGEEIPALSHTSYKVEDGVVTTERVDSYSDASTCTTAGQITYNCGRCSQPQTETGKALGHLWDDKLPDTPEAQENAGWTSADATCTTGGTKTRTCKRGPVKCDDYGESKPEDWAGKTESESTDALGHDLIVTVTPGDEPCKTPGTVTVTCSRADACSYSFDGELPDTFTVNASSSEGYQTVEAVTELITKGGTWADGAFKLNLADHTYTEEAEKETVNATCTADGHIAYVCTVCHTPATAEDAEHYESLTKLGHAYEREDFLAVKDTEKWTAGPNEKYKVNVQITDAETCGEKGKITFWCEDCSDTKDTEVPSGTKIGEKYYFNKLEVETEAKPHTPGAQHKEIPADCTHNACTYTLCSVCGEPIEETKVDLVDMYTEYYTDMEDPDPAGRAQKEYGAKGHLWGEGEDASNEDSWTKPSTTTYASKDEFDAAVEAHEIKHTEYCQREGCEYNKTTGKAKEEECVFAEAVTTPATCQKAGSISVTCTKCGVEIVYQTLAQGSGENNGHVYDKYLQCTGDENAYDAEAEVSTPKHQLVCKYCDAPKPETDPEPCVPNEAKAGVEKSKPNCTYGTVTTYECTLCVDAEGNPGKVDKDDEQISADAHVWIDHVLQDGNHLTGGLSKSVCKYHPTVKNTDPSKVWKSTDEIHTEGEIKELSDSEYQAWLELAKGEDKSSLPRHFDETKTAPDCEHTGYKYYVCKEKIDKSGDPSKDGTECNTIVYVSAPALNHKFELPTAHHEAQAPTCKNDGTIEYYECDTCHEKFAAKVTGEEHAPDLDHKLVGEEALIDPATGKHDFGEAPYDYEETPATCESNAMKRAKCKNCGTLASDEDAKTNEDLVIDEYQVSVDQGKPDGTKKAKDHVYEREGFDLALFITSHEDLVTLPEAKSFDCTEAAFDVTITCTDCEKTGTLHVDQQKDHNWSDGDYTDATCMSNAGSWDVCLFCGHVATEADGLDHHVDMYEEMKDVLGEEAAAKQYGAKGHDYVYTTNSDGTHNATCSRNCGEEGATLTNQKCELENVKSVPANCQSGAYTEGTCKFCKATVKEMVEGSEKDENVHLNETITVLQDPTCTDTGLEKHVCNDCSKKTWVSPPALGHEWDREDNTWVADLTPESGNVRNHTDPTCDTDGKEERKCGICGEWIEVKLDKTGHDFDETTEKLNTATGEVYFECKNDSTHHKHSRWICKSQLSDPANTKFGPVEMTVDHAQDGVEDTADPGFPATCTEAGRTAGTKCNICGGYSSGSVIEPKAHKTADGENALKKTDAVGATCGAPGNKDYWYCSECQKYFKNAEATAEFTDEDPYVIPATGKHTAKVPPEFNVEEEVPATCLKPGISQEPLCKDCGQPIEDATIPATGHNLVKVEAKDAQCEAPGNIAYYYCQTEGCKMYFKADGISSEDQLKMADEHHANYLGKDAEGLAKTVVQATGHVTLTKVEKQEPTTCGKGGEGHQEYWQCTKCQKKFNQEAEDGREERTDDQLKLIKEHTLNEESLVRDDDGSRGFQGKWVEQCDYCHEWVEIPMGIALSILNRLGLTIE